MLIMSTDINDIAVAMSFCIYSLPLVFLKTLQQNKIV